MLVSFVITNSVTKTLSVLAVIGDLIVILAVLFLLYKVVLKKEIGFLEKIKDKISKNALLFALIIALLATGGSLFYSELAGFDPCKLCWLQRIFMYPLVILFGVAYFKRDKGIFSYALPLAIIGGIISIYHYLVQTFDLATSCSFDPAVSHACSAKYLFEFGYITIPMLALTAFLLIIGISIIMKTNKTGGTKDEK